MPFMNPIAQRRRMSMMGRSVPRDRLMQSSSPRSQMLNDPNEPEMINRPPDVDKSGQYREELSKIRGDSPMSDQYNQMLQQAPTREEHQPGKLNRLAAILGGASAGWREGAGAGVATAQGINDTNYNRAMDDYYEKLQGAQSGAELERRGIEDQVGDWDTSMERRGEDFNRGDARVESDRGDAINRFGAGLDSRRVDLEEEGVGIDRERAAIAREDMEGRNEYYRGQNELGRTGQLQDQEAMVASQSQWQAEMDQELEQNLAKYAQIDPKDRIAVQQEGMRDLASGEYAKYFNLDNPDFPMIEPDTPPEIRELISEELYEYVEQFLNQTPRAY